MPALFPMEKGAEGFFSSSVSAARPRDLYKFQIDGEDPWPDPASRFQPQGVHGPSQLIDPSLFAWSDGAWPGVAPENLVLYELHVGAFTPEGTFAAAAEKLPLLLDLGITAVELMPVAEFPGARNWGYDGAALFAPARCYGTPDDLRRFVDAAHHIGLAVHLDVVYNHLGPDGSYLAAFSPFFLSTRHESPWGAALNFDGPHSGTVRRFFIENALHWIHEYHIDGLRLDATHAIRDESPKHFLSQLSEAVQDSQKDSRRQAVIVAEDGRNLSVIATPRTAGGWGLDGTWSDDFHHELHRGLTGENDGYFADFSGSSPDIASTVRQGWFYCGQFASYFGEPRGTDPIALPFSAFVMFLQNHDQVGNRALGERLNHLIDLSSYRAASALLLMAPETPLLFMGQEWASSSPFQYFTDHRPDLGRLVTEGRRKEFARFTAFSTPSMRERIPDPQDPATFARSHLDWQEAGRGPHAAVRRLYRELMHLRNTMPALRNTSRMACEIVSFSENGLLLCRGTAEERMLVVIQLLDSGTYHLARHSIADLPRGKKWIKVMSTEDPDFTDDPVPISFDGSEAQVQFRRPGALILRSTSVSQGDA